MAVIALLCWVCGSVIAPLCWVCGSDSSTVLGVWQCDSSTVLVFSLHCILHRVTFMSLPSSLRNMMPRTVSVFAGKPCGIHYALNPELSFHPYDWPTRLPLQLAALVTLIIHICIFHMVNTFSHITSTC